MYGYLVLSLEIGKTHFFSLLRKSSSDGTDYRKMLSRILSQLLNPKLTDPLMVEVITTKLLYNFENCFSENYSTILSAQMK